MSKLTKQAHALQVQMYSCAEVLPLLPLLHQWCAKHLHGFPYYYAPPKKQLIHPFDTVYVNEEQSLVVVAREESEVVGIAVGISLSSFYLDYNVSYVFSPKLMDEFKEKGHHPRDVLYIGYFLMAEEHKENREAIFGIFDQLIAKAKEWGKKEVCYIQVLCDESRMKQSPEPYGTIIQGFRHSGVELRNHSWPTLQSDGSYCMESHDMAFYVKDIEEK